MNLLLASLPDEERRRLSAHLKPRPLNVRQTLHKAGHPISEIYFPGRCMCSITHTMEDGRTIEVATVGYEGFVGVGAVLGHAYSMGDVVVQIQGEQAHVLSIESFNEEMDRSAAFEDAMSRYAQAFSAMVMQSVACNGLHSAEQRCSRWLLMTHDRMGADEFPLTHDVLAMMLGVRRPTVTLVLAELNRAGFLSHVRGRMRIIDRPGLEEASCECYRHVKSVFARLVPSSALGTTLATFQTRGGDLPAPAIERMSDVSRKPE
jgi:CRP-like cAMP-binding protein